MNIEAGQMKAGKPLTREYLYWHLPIDHPAIPNDIKQNRLVNQAAGMGDSTGAYTPSANDVANEKWATGLLALFDQYGANSTAELPPEVRQQLPNQGIFTSDYRGFMRQVGDFVTSTPFLMLVGGAGAMGAFGGAAAGAGAGSGAAAGSGAGTAAGWTAAEEAAMLTGSGGAGGGGLGAGAVAGGAATALPGEAGYLADTPMTSTTGATNTLPGGTATAAGTTAAGGTALSRLLAGDGTANDWAQLVGTGVDAYGAYQQRQDTKEIADRFFGMGAPYRDRLGELYSDPTAFLNSPEVKVPVQQGTDALARALSTQGNPAGSGSALHELQNYASNMLFGKLGQEKDRLAGFGGLTAYNSAAPGAAANAAGANANFYNSISGGIADMTTSRNQPNSLENWLRLMQGQT